MKGAKRTLLFRLIALTCGVMLIQIQMRSSDADASPSPQDLLIESYLSGQGFILGERAYLLDALARAASAISPSLARLWSKEAFQVALQLEPSWNRVADEKNAIEAIAPVDPDLAFQLLSEMDTPVPMENGSMPEDLRAFAARLVLPPYWKKHGAAGLGNIREEAQRVGDGGLYPFQAIAPIISDLSDSHPSEAGRLFSEALGYYNQPSIVGNKDEAFISLLESIWGKIPSSQELEALQILVGRLTEPSKPPVGERSRSRFYGKAGVAEFTDHNLALLYRILPKIRDLDPNWADQLEEKYSALRQAGGAGAQITYGGTTKVVHTSAAAPGQVQAMQGRLQEGVVLDEILKHAASDPQQALQQAQSLTEPEFQARAFAAIAAGMYKTSPKSAGELTDEAVADAARIGDDVGKVRALTAVAGSAAARNDLALARKEFDHAFDLADEAFTAWFENHPGALAYQCPIFDATGELVRVGVRIDEAGTMDRVRHVQDDVLRAYLLIDAAEEIHQLAHSRS